jgi:hypothetical protein
MKDNAKVPHNVGKCSVQFPTMLQSNLQYCWQLIAQDQDGFIAVNNTFVPHSHQV